MHRCPKVRWPASAALPPATLPQVMQQLGLNAATPAPAVKGKPRATQ
jgi:hypothetical protein